MFDIGFAELMMIGVVGLIVIGPSRLPETIRTLALWLGRARRTYSQFRKDLEEEIGADDIRQQLHNEDIMAQLKETQQQLKQSVDFDTQTSAKSKNDNDSNIAVEQTPLNKPSQPDKSNE